MNLQELFDSQKHSHHLTSSYEHVKGFQGKSHKDDTRARMSASHKVKTYKHSAETIASITAKNTARWPNIMTPKGVFSNSLEVSIAFDINRSTVHRWMQKFPEKYYYVEKV